MPEQPPRSDGDYEIRWYEPGDEEAYLALHESVLGSSYPVDWFEWRYDSPYLDHVPLVVALDDGELVGGRSFLPFPVRSEDDSVLAVQPAGTVVHPDHRRRGIYTRLVERSIEEYAEQDPHLVFNFPSPAVKSANLELGWREVGEIPLWLRLQRSIADGAGSSPLRHALKRSGAVYAQLATRVRLPRPRRDRELDIQRHPGVPARLLASIYRRSIPSKLHVERSEEFYAWRYANPMWDCTTYVAAEEGSPVGAVITGVRENYPRKRVLLDSLPVAPADQDRRIIDRLLRTIVSDVETPPILRAADSIAPSSVLWRCGFVRNDVPVVRRRADRKVMMARPFDPGGDSAWSLNGHRFDSREDWLVALGDTDGP